MITHVLYFLSTCESDSGHTIFQPKQCTVRYLFPAQEISLHVQQKGSSHCVLTPETVVRAVSAAYRPPDVMTGG